MHTHKDKIAIIPAIAYKTQTQSIERPANCNKPSKETKKRRRKKTLNRRILCVRLTSTHLLSEK